jgi:spore coat protein H
MLGKLHTAFILNLLVLISLLFRGCFQELIISEAKLSDNIERVIGFDNVYAFADTTDHLLLYFIGADTISSFTPLVNFEGYQRLYLDGKALEEGVENEIGQILINRSYQVIAQNEHSTDTFSLIFTPFPTVHIITEKEIPYEPKIISWMELQYCEQDKQGPCTSLFESYAGIEIRGHSSTHFDKKQYGVELWANKNETDQSASLLGMRYNEDWILDAMATDDLRMRSKLSYELWREIGSIPEEDRVNDVYPGIHREYIELFINNRYEGIYCLGEKMDENILRFSSNQNEKGGVLYEAIDKADGSTRFEVYQSEPVNSLTWDGWELIYPDHEFYWDPLAELRKTVVLKNDEEFTSSIGSLIDLKNVADLYIFYNLVLAYDNVGKNNFYARYTDQSRFFIIPCDLDYTWGRKWERLNAGPAGMIQNMLYERLIDNDVDEFRDLLEERWEDYRKTIFHEDTLLASVNKYYNELKKSGVIARENSRWEDVQIDLEYEYDYITDWIEQRLLILDNNFEEEQD